MTAKQIHDNMIVADTLWRYHSTAEILDKVYAVGLIEIVLGNTNCSLQNNQFTLYGQMDKHEQSVKWPN